MNSGVGGTLVLEHAANLIREGLITGALVTSAYLMWYPSVSKEYHDVDLLTYDEFGRSFDAEGQINSYTSKFSMCIVCEQKVGNVQHFEHLKT